MYKIREMKKTDINAINTLAEGEGNVHLHKKEQPVSEVTIENILAGNLERLYVIEESGAVRAFILFELDKESKQVHINKLTVEASYVKKGLDEHLYSKVERLADRGGYEQIMAEITTTSPVVHTFFEEKGWYRLNDSDEFCKGVNG
ncbi:GNAT family N-acetyltransferase [Virgibacillus ihumii]|uniref:GNAT family N-acetyltransferase n=1 Tax=Virgibacillus ihumii TaxID=2686091 RepID=UPI00157C5870|nr:GNAT family N-acetyltransferase [Virgibacillus ihumii]